MIQQLWQLPILDGLKDIGIWASENVYTMNDAAIAMLKSQNRTIYSSFRGDLQNWNHTNTKMV